MTAAFAKAPTRAASSAPLRVLHVVGGMNRAGAETWLVQLLRRIDPARVRMDFLVHGDGPQEYEPEIRAAGGELVRCPPPGRPLAYARAFRALVRERGYDVVHSHLHHFSGFALWLARTGGVPVRLAHSHLDTQREAISAPRKLYAAIARASIQRHATAGVAVSRVAGEALFGPGWERDPRWRVLPCGIDLAPFQAVEGADEPRRVRAELGIPPEALVLGHVGRFAPQKNHGFLLATFAAVARAHPRAWLLLVGDGPLRPGLQEEARRLGLAGRVVFAGSRSDVPRLVRSAMDVFVFPSLFEGLPLSLVEAQAAGLPCVFTDSLAEEVDLAPAQVRRLSLEAGPEAWARAVSGLPCTAAEKPADIPRHRPDVSRWPYRIECSASALESLYLALAPR